MPNQQLKDVKGVAGPRSEGSVLAGGGGGGFTEEVIRPGP